MKKTLIVGLVDFGIAALILLAIKIVDDLIKEE